MSLPDRALRIQQRLTRAGAATEPGAVAALATYLDVLAQWNRRVNLTALDLDSDEGIDRLIVEPVVAARQVLATDRLAIDVGSGGGSPGLPFRIAAPHLRVLLVESKGRKCAFLREVIRRLALTGPQVEVVQARFEELAGRPDVAGQADWVTVRAVSVDAALLGLAAGLLRPEGRLGLFSASGAPRLVESRGWSDERVEPLVGGSELRVLTRRQADSRQRGA